jgi:hypothetical protein
MLVTLVAPSPRTCPKVLWNRRSLSLHTAIIDPHGLLRTSVIMLLLGCSYRRGGSEHIPLPSRTPMIELRYLLP